MSANLAELQQRATATTVGRPVKSDDADADGDACTSAMLSMLGAMHDISVAPRGAPPTQPNVA